MIGHNVDSHDMGGHGHPKESVAATLEQQRVGVLDSASAQVDQAIAAVLGPNTVDFVPQQPDATAPQEARLDTSAATMAAAGYTVLQQGYPGY